MSALPCWWGRSCCLTLLKLALIAVAGVNALVFHVTVYRPAAAWAGTQGGGGAPWQARAQAMLSMLLWLAVICCGRLLAYV